MPRPPTRRRLTAVAAVLALVPLGAAGAAGAASAAPSPHPAARPHAPAKPQTVTLVTGDKVTVTDLGHGRKTVSVDRPAGAHGGVRTTTVGGDIRVIPDDARRYLAAGNLDQRLFDVSALLRDGYDDAHRKTLPLIVTRTKSAPAAARSAAPAGTTRTRALPAVRGAAVAAPRTGRAGFWRSVTTNTGHAYTGGVAHIWLDGTVRGTMADSNAQIGSPKAWDAGYTGKGVKVAVLDTGVDTTHPDLKDRISGSQSFIAGEEIADRHGHGTHTASTVGGSGAASDGKEKGVAPDSSLYIGKVLSDAGTGTESQIIAGMQWAAKDVGAKVISMSLGSDTPSDGTDPMSQAVNTLTAQYGSLFVIAAGNYTAPGSIGSPGAADDALTVAAVDSSDQLAYFSSQGPRFGDGALKPDISGPGVDILAARSQLTAGTGYYTTMSGTSMATPHVAGAAALLSQEHPDWDAAQLKNALMSTSKQVDGSTYATGAGRVDIAASTAARTTATGSADFGFTAWGTDPKPVTRTLTYRNDGDQPETLALADTGSAPAGTVTLKDTSITVPAHGTASTEVTGDPAKAPAGKNTTGQITATDANGTVVAHTGYGLTKEAERYSLTVHLKDRDGKPAAGQYVDYQQYAKGVDPSFAQADDTGTVQLRLPPGTYSVDSIMDVHGSGGADSLGSGLLVDPTVTLDHDQDVTLDGRTLHQVTAKAPIHERTQAVQRDMRYARTLDGVTYTATYQVPGTYDSLFAAPTAKVADGSFDFRSEWRLQKPFVAATVHGKELHDPIMQAGSTLMEGDATLDVVDAGHGTPADYASAGAKGKAAVITAADGANPAQLAADAAAAGVKALYVTDHTPGNLYAGWGDADGKASSVQIATVDAADAALLRSAAADHAKLDQTGTQYSPYTYNLTRGYTGAIPDASLAIAPKRSELARLNTKFHAPWGSTKAGGAAYYPITQAFPIGVGGYSGVGLPGTRTDWMTAEPGLTWHDSVVSDADPALEERGGLNSWKAGSTQELDWFKPIWHPYLGTGLGWGQQRSGDQIQMNAPGWGDSGPDHTGFGDYYSPTGMKQTTKLYEGDKLVDSGSDSTGYDWQAPAAETDYKLTTDTTLDAATWRLGTQGHSEWTFRSGHTDDTTWTYLPLINLDYQVATDLEGNVPAGRPLTFGLHASYVAKAAGTGTLSGLTAAWSADHGTTWHDISLTGSGADAHGTIDVPKDAGPISVRASAKDDKGGSVTQELTDALGVK